MASYNSILRHVDMTNVKRNTLRLQEQRREEERRIQEERDKIRYKNSPQYSDWRFDLNEGMTTQSMTYATTLPGEGDTILGDASGWTDAPFGSYDEGGVSSNGSTVIITPNDIPVLAAGGEFQQAVANTAPIDARDFTTAKLTLTRTSVGSQDSNVRIFANYGSPSTEFYINEFYGETGSVTSLINIANYQNLDKLRFQIRASKQTRYNSGTDKYVSVDTSSYTFKVEFQRRTPITVFVPLDSPEAVSFVRTELGDKGLTPEEREKKIQQLLDASDEYLALKFGDAFPGTGVVLNVGLDDVKDYYNKNASPTWTGESPDPSQGRAEVDQVTDTIGLIASGLGGVALANAGLGAAMNKLTSDIASNLVKSGLKLDKWINKGKNQRIADEDNANFFDLIVDDLKQTGKFDGGQGGILPKNMKELGDLLTGKGGFTWSFSRGLKTGPTPIQRQIMRRGKQFTNFMQQLTNGQGLEEETIMERKLKGPKAFFNDKDIKPEFPENPPPPQIKGLHPDLVTGEKTAQRFNKLDPISAKAMPRTGIKAIDKKVAIAKKKPK